MRKAIKRQHTIVGRLRREIQRKATQLSLAVREALGEPLDKSGRILQQSVGKNRRNNITAKLYSWHAPEVQCINKGKSRTPYEFGAKVGIALTLKSNLIVGARSFEGNPYDGHTLYEQIEQEIKLLSRRQAVEPIIGHLKEDHRMGRCHLKGEEGDRLHAVLCAAGYNIRWLLRMIEMAAIPPIQLCVSMLRVAIAPADARSMPRLGWI
jgi:IS5 family transposase